MNYEESFILLDLMNISDREINFFVNGVGKKN